MLGAAISQLSYLLSIDYSAKNSVNFWLIDVFLAKQKKLRVRRVTKLVEPIRIRLGSWNVGSLTGKLRELVDTTVRRRVNILCVQKTK